LVIPPHDDGSGAHVTPAHAELPWQTDSLQQFVSVAQSLAMHGQHS
jgi:hypothetical protein